MMLSVCLILLLCFYTGTGAATIQYQYDANGNLIQGDGKHFRYNDVYSLVAESEPQICTDFRDFTDYVHFLVCEIC